MSRSEPVEMTIDDLTVKVLGRSPLVQIKRHVGRPKDLEVALELAVAEDEDER